MKDKSRQTSKTSAALIRECETCGSVTAIDLDDTPEHWRELQHPGGTVKRLPKEEALTLWRECGGRCDHRKLIDSTRRALSALFAEQATGICDDSNEQVDKLLAALYEAGAARAAALLEKYAPRCHGLSHERKCPACGGWWPRHANNCEIASLL